MKNKHYVFNLESYWDDNGCDCCEPTLYETYNCLSHENYCGYSLDIDDVRVCIIIHALSLDEDTYETLERFSWEEIEALLLDNEITYEIVEV